MRKPFANRYSVMPSTVGPRVTPFGSRTACAVATPSAANKITAVSQRQAADIMAAVPGKRSAFCHRANSRLTDDGAARERTLRGPAKSEPAAERMDATRKGPPAQRHSVLHRSELAPTAKSAGA